MRSEEIATERMDNAKGEERNNIDSIQQQGAHAQYQAAATPRSQGNDSLPLATGLKHSRPRPPSTSPISAKRQRLENAKVTLAKPFRSPMLIGRGGGPKLPRNPGTTSQPTRPPLVTPSIAPTFQISYTQPSFVADPEIAALKAQLTTLRAHLKSETTYLSMSEQALMLESLSPNHKNSDQSLAELRLKWRNTARQAADYLFGVAGDRMNMMGGARSYFERARERKSQWEGDNADQGIGTGWAGIEYGEIDQVTIEERKRQLMAEYDLEETSANTKSKAEEVNTSQRDDVSIYCRLLPSREVGADPRGDGG